MKIVKNLKISRFGDKKPLEMVLDLQKAVKLAVF